MNSPTTRIVALASAIAFLSTLLGGIGGCAASYPTVEGRMSASAPISGSPAIAVRSLNGGIKVVRGDLDVMSVQATVRARNADRLSAARIRTEQVDGGAYEVSVAWPGDERLKNEGADFLITVPAASELVLESSNGAFVVEGLDAAVAARTSNGSISIIGPSRSVDAVTSNGTIYLEGVTGSVVARSSNGWVRALLAPENNGPVQMTTSNGNLTLRIGPAFEGEVEMWTSNGAVSVDGFTTGDSPSFLESRRNYLRLGFGDQAQQSKLRTSNGTVTVRPL
ncbi:hypothetical protein ABWH91_13140 [Phycisphaerales bacterium ac7]